MVEVKVISKLLELYPDNVLLTVAKPIEVDLNVTVHVPPDVTQEDGVRVPLVVVSGTVTPDAPLDKVALMIDDEVPSAGTDAGVAEIVTVGVIHVPQSEEHVPQLSPQALLHVPSPQLKHLESHVNGLAVHEQD